MDIDVFIWNSQENRTPMSKTLPYTHEQNLKRQTSDQRSEPV